MRANDVASYFVKKIAKPITYDIEFYSEHRPTRRFYVIETTAVENGVLHAMVTLKSEITDDIKKIKQPQHCGEVEIPFRDGDSIQSVLDMILVDADFKEESRFLTLVDRTDRMSIAYAALQERLEKTSGLRL